MSSGFIFMILVLISISIFIVKGQEERVKSIMEPGPIFSKGFDLSNPHFGHYRYMA
jgi:hypothetical protein